MPNPLKLLHTELGLWPKWLLPTEAVCQVLRHLMLPGEPRLYVNRVDGRESGFLSNSESVAGRPTGVGFALMIMHGWICKDEAITRISIRTITVYMITEKGREAIAQMEAYKGLENLLRLQVPRILDLNYQAVGLAKDYKRTNGQ